MGICRGMPTCQGRASTGSVSQASGTGPPARPGPRPGSLPGAAAPPLPRSAPSRCSRPPAEHAAVPQESPLPIRNTSNSLKIAVASCGDQHVGAFKTPRLRHGVPCPCMTPNAYVRVVLERNVSERARPNLLDQQRGGVAHNTSAVPGG